MDMCEMKINIDFLNSVWSCFSSSAWIVTDSPSISCYKNLCCLFHWSLTVAEGKSLKSSFRLLLLRNYLYKPWTCLFHWVLCIIDECVCFPFFSIWSKWKMQFKKELKQLSKTWLKMLKKNCWRRYKHWFLVHNSFGFSQQFVWNEMPEIYSFTSSSLYPTMPLCEWAIFLTRVSCGKYH